jgi:hypothetical protein
MAEKQQFPISDDLNSSVVQRNFSDLYQYAHQHIHRTVEPKSADGNIGDMVPVTLNGCQYLYVKYPTGWERAFVSGESWDDLRVPGTSVRNGSSAPDLELFAGSATLYISSFAGSGPAEMVYFSVQMPHAWKEGSMIYPHVHWSPTTTGAGGVTWQLEYTLASAVAGIFPASTTLASTSQTTETAWQHQITSFDGIDMTGHTISTMIHCRLFRDPAHSGDTYSSDAAFLEFDFHYNKDSTGSEQPFHK